MDSRAAKLQTLKDRWFTEQLAVQFPSLGVAMPNPTTRAEFVTSERIIAAEEAANLEHFGVLDPKATLAALSAQFKTAPQVDTKVLKDAAVILDVFKNDSQKLAVHFTTKQDDMLRGSYEADARAADDCKALVAALASELGINLPTRDTGNSRG